MKNTLILLLGLMFCFVAVSFSQSTIQGTGNNFGSGWRQDSSGNLQGTGNNFGSGWKQNSSDNLQGTGKEYPKNKNPFAAWNDPRHKDSSFAPHNKPIDKTSPFKPWNSPMGNNDDLTKKEKQAYGLPQSDSYKSPFSSGIGDNK